MLFFLSPSSLSPSQASEKVAVGRSDAENLVVTKDDFEHGLLHDIKPAFGISEEELDRYVFNGKLTGTSSMYTTYIALPLCLQW